jgi:single-strand DNA-binding protein
MPTLNQVLVMGHLGRDPEVRYSKNGKSIANCSIATSYKPQNGQEQVTWHKIVAFGAMADQLQACKKGDLVMVTGRLQENVWEDKDGGKRKSMEIVAGVLVKGAWLKGEGQERQTGRAAAPAPSDDDDDEIPFNSVPF